MHAGVTVMNRKKGSHYYNMTVIYIPDATLLDYSLSLACDKLYTLCDSVCRSVIQYSPSIRLL